MRAVADFSPAQIHALTMFAARKSLGGLTKFNAACDALANEEAMAVLQLVAFGQAFATFARRVTLGACYTVDAFDGRGELIERRSFENEAQALEHFESLYRSPRAYSGEIMLGGAAFEGFANGMKYTVCGDVHDWGA